jgi:hypothetical protein
MLHKQKHSHSPAEQESSLIPLYGRTALNTSLPKAGTGQALWSGDLQRD